MRPRAGYDYGMPEAQPGDPYFDQYGKLAYFRKNCADPAITSCEVSSDLWTRFLV